MKITPRQWDRVRELFAEATRLDAAQRKAYLDTNCRSAQIREEVELLLAEYDHPENLPGVYSSVGGKILSHYQLRGRRLGEGGLAFVYKARDKRLRRWVAIKILQPWAMAHARFRRRLIQEARYASALNHPNIVTIYEVAEEGGVGFIVMELVDGKTLQALIPPNGFPAREALSYALQMADALHYAHTTGILHSDLKPLNVMVTDSGQVKLLDFGLAGGFGAGKSRKTEVQFGTKAYMAPERLAKVRLDSDPRSEIFSFGLILHEMLSGGHAFGDDRELPEAILQEPPRALPPEVPASLAHVVGRCLEKNAEQRFQSMEDLFHALRECEGSETLSGSLLPLGSVTKENPTRTAARNDAAELREVRAALDRIGYENVARSRQALADLERLMKDSPSVVVRDAVTSALKDLVLAVGDYGGGPVPMRVREVRKLVLDVMKISTQGNLGRCFKEHELEHLDLFAMNFADQRLTGMSFRGSFLVESSFERCDLSQALFAGAWVRNVNFTQADLLGADFTDADWFNALGLTETQLQAVRQDTLVKCPADIAAMHRYLKGRYGLPFESWSVHVQQQLHTAWQEYLRPGGLRDALRVAKMNNLPAL